MIFKNTTQDTAEAPVSGRHWLARSVDVATLVVLAIAAVGWWRVKAADPPRAPSGPIQLTDSIVGQVALITASGESISLLPAETKQPTLVFLFRSNCPFCGQQKPSWEAAALAATQSGANVVAVTGEPKSTIADSYFVSSPAITVAYSAANVSIFEELHAQVVPTTIVVGPDGRIQYHHQGLLSDSSLSAVVAGIASRGGNE